MRNSFIKSISSALSAALLAACGGGGGDSGGGGGGGTAPGPITLTGYVARAQPLSGATVNAKCASGTGTATSAADGRYTMSFAGVLPCVLRAVSGSDTYHSVVYGTSPTCPACTANISLFTEMMVAKFAGQAPDAYYNGFSCSPGTECIGRVAVEATLPYLSTALGLDLNLSNINILTAVYGPNSSIELKAAPLVARMTSNNVTAAQLTAAIVANPNDAAKVAALIP